MMEVSGVLMSWETFVMSSVLSRSLLSCFSTARLIPSPTEFKFSAWRLKSQYMCFVGIFVSKSPAASAAPPFCSLRSCIAAAQVSRDTSSATRIASPTALLLHSANTKSHSTRLPSAVFHTSGMPRRMSSSSLPKAARVRWQNFKILQQSFSA